jgi:osmotically-inducible protein OsmY
MSRSPVLLAFSLFILLALGCGAPDPEEALRKASAALAEREAVLEGARAELELSEAAAASAEEARERAVQAVRDAEQRKRAAEDEVAEHASDDVLFRTVQRRLLEERALDGVAIAAEVSGRVVTLSGTVHDAELRDLAVSLAAETPGVADVRSQIRVRAQPDPDRQPTIEPVPDEDAAPAA